jgi:hypothetical protein
MIVFVAGNFPTVSSFHSYTLIINPIVMKKIFFLAAVLSSVASLAQWETVTGNGHPKKESRQTSAYTGVVSNGSIDVELSFGKPGNISIEADENLLPYIETVVENGDLFIKTKNKTRIRKKRKITIWVPVSTLANLKLSGSGNIKGDGAFSNNSATAVVVSGSGNIDLGFDSFAGIQAIVSGSGNVKLKGKNTGQLEASVSGSGNVDASNVTASNVVAKIRGSGDVRVNASQSLDAKISGSGNVYYKGNASKVSSKTSGRGKIIKA